MIPDSFLTPIHLPFNRASLAGTFEFLAPQADPGGLGVALLLRGGSLAVVEGESGLRLPDDTTTKIVTADGFYLGQWQGKPCRVVRVDSEQELPEPISWRELLSPIPQLPIDLLSLGGLASQALYWDRNSRFCSRCGASTKWLAGSWGKRCSGCKAEHFPHVHPCVIVAIRRPGEILLGRKAQWAEGRYSLIAGFLDMGECLEEAVVREVAEETGVRVENIRYIGSQSWPFPSQLMAGFVADYAGGDIRIDNDELEDAAWFPVDALPKLPPKRSIARYLIDNFKDQP